LDDDARRRREAQRQRATAAPAWDPAAIPEQIAAKYLRNDDKYYFADQTLAFIDKGGALTVKTENLAVIKDVIAIAQARGWEALAVTGTKHFRREVWKEAFAQGLTVTGHTPTDLELQAAERERARRVGPNEIRDDGRQRPLPAAQGDRQHAAPPQSAAAVDQARSTRAQLAVDVGTNPATGVVYGRLLEHGEAPYQFNDKNTKSYYVKLDLGDGKVHTYWGVGLPDAMRESQTKPATGALVGVQQVGSRPVTVTTQTVDEAGQPVTRLVATHRNEWVVENADYFLDTRRMAQDLAARQQRAEAAVAAPSPPLRPAAASPSAGIRSNDPGTGVVYGRMLEHGAAPWQFDESKPSSYYVKLDLGDGTPRTFWGLGLADAMRDSKTNPAIGDSVGIEQLEMRPVTMSRPARNAAGQLVDETVRVTRHEWVVEQSPYFLDTRRMAQDRQQRIDRLEAADRVRGAEKMQEAAAAVRSAQMTREELHRNHPILSAAVFDQMAAHDTFAEAFVKAGLIRQEDRAQVIATMRERLASQVERGEKIAEADRKKITTIIQKSVLRAADEVGRTPIQTNSDRVTEAVRTPKSLVRDDAHARA
jgi:hypothetical protein